MWMIVEEEAGFFDGRVYARSPRLHQIDLFRAREALSYLGASVRV
jgi:hypothetical protein